MKIDFVIQFFACMAFCVSIYLILRFVHFKLKRKKDDLSLEIDIMQSDIRELISSSENREKQTGPSGK